MRGKVKVAVQRAKLNNYIKMYADAVADAAVAKHDPDSNIDDVLLEIAEQYWNDLQVVIKEVIKGSGAR